MSSIVTATRMRIPRKKTDPEVAPEPERPTLTVSQGAAAKADEARRKKIPAWGHERRQLDDWPRARRR